MPAHGIKLMFILIPAISSCRSDLDCSLNGICRAGTCDCDAPWTGTPFNSSGPACASLQFKVTPATAKNIYNSSDPRNTWNGPIVTGPDGMYHIYDPLYKAGSLGGPITLLHGVAKNITGPWDWQSRPNMPIERGENPAAVVYKDDGKLVYSLWMGGTVRTSSSPDGPFVDIKGFSYPGGNPAPIYHNGAFYMTNQVTKQILTTANLEPGAVWRIFSTINHPSFPGGRFYRNEDPFMWVDKRGNWHIINHAYRNDQYENCGSSVVSSHFYSPDGKTWSWGAQPYGHTVQYDDGSSHTYTTLERPNLHFDSAGKLTHINLAADLIVGDEGCAARTKHAHFGHTPCDNCKWDDHAGTIVIALEG